MNNYERAVSMFMRDPDTCVEIAKLVSRKLRKKLTARPMSMTRRMRELYEFVRDYTEANSGVAPSFDEMMAHMGLTSKSGVHRMLTALEERGAIRRLPNRARAIVCVEQEIVKRATAPIKEEA